MEVTITAGYWLIPAVVTAIAWLFVSLKFSKFALDGGIGDIAAMIVLMLLFTGAAIVTLLAWLVYFIIF